MGEVGMEICRKRSKKGSGAVGEETEGKWEMIASKS